MKQTSNKKENFDKGDCLQARYTSSRGELRAFLQSSNLWVREAAIQNEIAMEDEMLRETLAEEIEPNVQLYGVMNPVASPETVLYVAQHAAHPLVRYACIKTGKLDQREVEILSRDPRVKRFL